MTQSRKRDRIALTIDDRPQDGLPGGAHNVLDHDAELDVHLLERLLHMQNMRRAMLD